MSLLLHRQISQHNHFDKPRKPVCTSIDERGPMPAAPKRGKKPEAVGGGWTYLDQRSHVMQHRQSTSKPAANQLTPENRRGEERESSRKRRRAANSSGGERSRRAASGH